MATPIFPTAPPNRLRNTSLTQPSKTTVDSWTEAGKPGGSANDEAAAPNARRRLTATNLKKHLSELERKADRQGAGALRGAVQTAAESADATANAILSTMNGGRDGGVWGGGGFASVSNIPQFQVEVRRGRGVGAGVSPTDSGQPQDVRGGASGNAGGSNFTTPTDAPVQSRLSIPEKDCKQVNLLQ